MGGHGSHMHPKVILLDLPGKQMDDKTDVTTFDIISQFQLLLSDPILDIP